MGPIEYDDSGTIEPLIPKPRPVARLYSDDTRASALAILASCGGNVGEAARLTGIPSRTLANWRDRPTSGAVRASQPIREELLGQAMERLIWKLLRSAKGKVGNAKLPAVLNGLAHMFDRWRLLKQSSITTTCDSVPSLNLGNLSTEELRAMMALIQKAGGSTEGLADDDNYEEAEIIDEAEAISGGDSQHDDGVQDNPGLLSRDPGGESDEADE